MLVFTIYTDFLEPNTANSPMKLNHDQLTEVFQYLKKRGFNIAEPNFDMPDTRITFSSFQYESKRLEKAYRYLNNFYGHCVDISYISHIGLVISMREIDPLLIDETTELIDGSVCLEIEHTEELETNPTKDRGENTSKPTSERFGFIL